MFAFFMTKARKCYKNVNVLIFSQQKEKNSINMLIFYSFKQQIYLRFGLFIFNLLLTTVFWLIL